MTVFVFGLGAIIALVAAMKRFGFNEGMINAFLALSFLLLLVIEGTFIWLLLSDKKRAKKESYPELLKDQPAKELYSAPSQVLSEPGQTVTENTTRNLEPIYSRRKSE